MADDADRYRRRYERERSARLQAERIAEGAIAALSASNRELDARVHERTAELEVALERASRTDQVKSAFLQGLAHEMSTPMHAVRGFVELVSTRTDDDQIRRAAAQADAAATRLHSALRTLLGFAAATAGDVSVDPRPVRLGDYADAVADRWRLPAARAGMLLETDIAPDPGTLVVVDPDRLDQIVDALLDNAVRFGTGQIELTVRADTDAGCLRLSVIDGGAGVPDDIRDSAFDAFVRGDNATDGFGVGLTLARAVAGALGGTVELDLDAPGGRVDVVVPIAT